MSESYAEVIVHDEKDIKGKQLAVVLTAVTAALLCMARFFRRCFSRLASLWFR